MRTGILCLAAIAALSAVAPCQTFVIDAAASPGSNFTSISTAIITVLGGTGFGITSEIIVHNTTGAQAVTLRGLNLGGFDLCYTTPVMIRLQNCSGPVLLESVRTTTGLLGRCVTVPCAATGCSHVVLRDCIFGGRTSLTDSTTVLDGGVFAGWIYEGGNAATAGLGVTRSNIQIRGAAVSGGTLSPTRPG